MKRKNRFRFVRGIWILAAAGILAAILPPAPARAQSSTPREETWKSSDAMPVLQR